MEFHIIFFSRHVVLELNFVLCRAAIQPTADNKLSREWLHNIPGAHPQRSLSSRTRPSTILSLFHASRIAADRQMTSTVMDAANEFLLL